MNICANCGRTIRVITGALLTYEHVDDGRYYCTLDMFDFSRATPELNA